MSAERTFRHITPQEIAWRLEFGEGNPDYVELFWLDVDLDDGTQIGIGLYGRRPFTDGLPSITINLLRPGRPYRELHETFQESAFTPLEFGGRWGANTFVGTLDDQGRPATFRLTLAVDDLELDLLADVVASGVKFTTASPGYTHFRADTGTAVGWWPVAPRADARGSLRIDGAAEEVSGRIHLEKQLSSLPLAGVDGDASAQSVWTWGHLSAGEYTAIWTDSAASTHLGYRHFSPFVLYRGASPVLSTFAFSSTVERFTIDADTGLPRPLVVTLRADDGVRSFFARLVDGTVSDQFELNGRAGAFYCRQRARCEIELSEWGARTHLQGHAVHEWGTQAGNFPFAVPADGGTPA